MARKPYRQKGTGRARQGSTRAPQFAGGGVVHGPKPRDYAQRTPKKMKAAALRGALSDRARDGRVHVVSGLVDGDAPSTKAALASRCASRHRAARTCSSWSSRDDELSWKSLRNCRTVHLLAPDQLNTYDVLVSDDVVFTAAALEAFLAGPTEARSPASRSRASSSRAPTSRRRPPNVASWPKADAKKAAATGRRVTVDARPTRGRRRRGRGARRTTSVIALTRTPATSCSRRSSPRRATACSTRTSTRSSSHPDANKTEIKIAVEKVFGVKVTASTRSTARASASAPAPASASARTPSARSSRSPRRPRSRSSAGRSS